MKNVLKIVSVLVALVVFSSVSVFATVDGSYEAFNVSFTTQVPSGWEATTNKTLTFGDNGMGISENGNLTLFKNDVYTPRTENGYKVTFNVGKPGQNTFLMHVGMDAKNNFTEVYSLVKTSETRKVAASGYTIIYETSATNTLAVYKDGVILGNGMSWSDASAYLPAAATIELEIRPDSVTVTMTNSASTSYKITQTVSNTNPHYSGYMGLNFNAIKYDTAYVASISATEFYDGHLSNYVIDDDYTAQDLAADGFTYTPNANNPDYTPLYSHTVGGNEVNGIFLGVRDNSTDIRRYGGTLMHNAELCGDYDIEYVGYFQLNNLPVNINYTDDKNRYVLKYGKIADGQNGCQLYKYAGSSTPEVISPISATKNGSEYTTELVSTGPTFTYGVHKTHISVKNVSDGLAITATITAGEDKYVFNFKDSSNPITTGKFGINGSSVWTVYVNNIKIYGGSLKGMQTFSNGGKALLSLPFDMSGDIKVLSGIYTNDNKMVKVTLKDISAFADKSVDVEMFSEAETEGADKMKTFIWSGLDSMIPLVPSIE